MVWGKLLTEVKHAIRGALPASLSYPLVSGRVRLDEVANPSREGPRPRGVSDSLGNLAGTDGTP